MKIHIGSYCNCSAQNGLPRNSKLIRTKCNFKQIIKNILILWFIWSVLVSLGPIMRLHLSNTVQYVYVDNTLFDSSADVTAICKPCICIDRTKYLIKNYPTSPYLLFAKLYKCLSFGVVSYSWLTLCSFFLTQHFDVVLIILLRHFQSRRSSNSIILSRSNKLIKREDTAKSSETV